MLQHRQTESNVSAIQPRLRLLRCPAHPAPGPDADFSHRVQGASPSGAARLGGVWPLRAADQDAGSRTALHWPGKSAGIRAPEFGENPLSWDEVAFAVRAGLTSNIGVQ